MARVLIVIVTVLVWSSPVHAATVALLRPAGKSPELTEALFRLQGELLAVGLAVELTDPPAPLRSDVGARNAWFESVAAERRIDAILDILGDPVPVGVDIWIFQEQTQRFRASRVVLEPDAPNPPETLAIRAIEVLRANFLVIDAPAPPPEQPESTAPGIEPTRDEAPEPRVGTFRFGFAAGATVLTSLDGVGPALQPLVRFDFGLPAGFAAEATLSAFGTRPTVETDAGSVQVAQDYGVLGLRYTAPTDSKLAAFLALAGGALKTTLEGSADSPNRGHQVADWAFVAEGSLGARLAISRRYSLTLAAHVQFTTPYAAIHFVDERVASTGRPNLLASLTVGAWL